MQLENQRKKSSLPWIGIIVLIVGVICFVLGVSYSKWNHKEKEPSTPPDNSEQENLGTSLSTEDKDLVEIHQLIRTNYACDGENHLFNQTKKTVDDFTETEMMMLLLNQMKIPLKENFTYNQINNQAKRTFGKNFTFEKKSYESCPKYNLNQEKKAA